VEAEEYRTLHSQCLSSAVFVHSKTPFLTMKRDIYNESHLREMSEKEKGLREFILG